MLANLKLIERKKNVYIPLNLNKWGGDHNFIIQFHTIALKDNAIFLQEKKIPQYIY